MALALLQNPTLIEEFLKTLHTCYVDRDDELILLKLATVSRHFESGISVVITGTSSVGKSEMVKAILKTVAEKDKEDFTRITQNYLLYSDNPLDHKIVTIFEMKGTEDSAHILRTALTEGKLILGTVDKNITGELGARKIEKSSEGIVFISTLASGQLDWEFSTRILALELTHDETLARKVFNQKAKRVQTAQDSSNTVDQRKSPRINYLRAMAH